jgi:PAS domain S-box
MMDAELEDAKRRIHVEEKREELDVLLDRADNFLAMIDTDLRYIHVNKAYACWLSLPKAEFHGKLVSETFNNHIYNILLSKFKKALQGEHVQFMLNDGSSCKTVELTPYYGKNSTISGIIWTARDFMANPKLYMDKPNNKSRNFFWDDGLNAIAVLTPEIHICQSNSNWEKIFGYTVQDLENRNLSEVFYGPDQGLLIQKINELKINKKSVNFLSRIQCKEGPVKWAEWQMFWNLDYIYAMATDISGYMNMLEDKESSINKLLELNSSKDQFMAIIAHDLKSPFGTIMGFASLLQQNIDTYDKGLISQILEQLHNSSKIAYEMLENLLDWSRVQTDRIEFEPAQFKFNEFIDSYLPVLQAIATRKQITIKTLVSGNLKVFADLNLTKTILRNLVSNAVKYSNVNQEVTIKAERTDEGVVIAVTDKGVGIPEKEIGKLFRIDTKHSTPGTSNEKGTGFGLILCKDFVEKQGGRIWIESTEGLGSTFFFTLPC